MKDSSGRNINYLRLALTDRCNLCCDYCRSDRKKDAEKLDGSLSFDDFRRILEVSAALGMTKVRLTGGEPLLSPDLLPLIRFSKSRFPGISVHLTTNGTLLADAAADLLAAGIDGINISLDTLDPLKYSELTRGGSLKNVLSGIAALDESGFGNIKINTVLMQGVNDDEFDSLIAWALDNERTLRFIELMPIGEAIGLMDSRSVLVDRLIRNHGFFINGEIHSEGTAYYYSHGSSAARIGFITPLRGPFCERCNKIRINSAGELRPCLLSGKVILLKDVLDDPAALQERIAGAVRNKPACGLNDETRNVPMVRIGG